MEQKLYDKKIIRKEILFLIIPIMLENMFQMSAGVVSSAMIGKLGEMTPMLVSSQGISNRITGVLWCLFKGLGIGATVVIAKARGEEDSVKCKKTFEQTAITGCIISILLIIIVLVNLSKIVLFFSNKEDTMKYAMKYLSIVIFTSPAVVIMSCVTASFQALGNTKTPMFIAIFVNIINIILGYTLIYGKFGFPELDLTGAAVAILIAQTFGALLGIYLLYNRRSGLFSQIITKRELKINFKLLKQVYSIGIPAGLENMFWQLSSTIMSKAILSYGEVTFSAYQFGLQAELMSEMPAVGVGIASTSLASRAIGRKDEILLKIYTKELLLISGIISSFCSIFILIFPSQLMSFFTNDISIQKIGINYLIVMGFIQIPQNVSKVLNGVLRSAGYRLIPMVTSFIGTWGVRVPLAIVFTYAFRLDVIYIWMCMALDQIIKCIISWIMFKVKKADTIRIYEDANV